MTTTANIRLNQGETFRWSFVVGTASSDPNVIEPWDLNGCTGRMQVREQYGTPVLLEISTENGGIVIGGTPDTPVMNQIDLLMTAEQTDKLGVTPVVTKPRRNAVYDLEITYPSGDVRRILQGGITISPNITREVSND